MKLFQLIQIGAEEDIKMKNRINWSILLWSTFFILVVLDYKNLKYLINLIRELYNLSKKRSKYIEDGDFVLVHKKHIKNV